MNLWLKLAATDPGFAKGADHSERSGRESKRRLGAEPPVGSRGRAGAKPPPHLKLKAFCSMQKSGQKLKI